MSMMILSTPKHTGCVLLFNCLLSFAASSSCMLSISFATAFSFAPLRTRIFASSSSATKNTARKMTATTPLTTLEDHSTSYATLLDKLRTITHLNHASSVLNYDRQVFMAKSNRASLARGKQMAELATITQEKSTDPEIGMLIDKAMSDLNELSTSCEEEANGEGVGKVSSEELTKAKRIRITTFIHLPPFSKIVLILLPKLHHYNVVRRTRIQFHCIHKCSMNSKWVCQLNVLIHCLMRYNLH